MSMRTSVFTAPFMTLQGRALYSCSELQNEIKSAKAARGNAPALKDGWTGERGKFSYIQSHKSWTSLKLFAQANFTIKLCTTEKTAP